MLQVKFVFAVTFLICGFDCSNNVIENLTDDILISDLQSDEFLDSMGFLEKYGYPAEKVEVTSEKGYITTLFHIPGDGSPILLNHGVSDTSDGWLLLGPGRSLAYKLSDAGFDVWLFNHRGNRYSKGNRMNVTKKQYWDFSFEEMGTEDLPAVIDHILDVTSREKLSYIGFSQGTTIFFVMCSMRPEYNNKIDVPILLGPVAWVSYLKMPFVSFVLESPELFKALTIDIGLYELFPFDPQRAFNVINCHRKINMLCNIEYYLNFGLKKSSYLSPDKITVIDSHSPAGVSAKNLLHFIQSHVSKRFQRFDYGPERNRKMYSSKYPPLYDVKLITVPVNLIASEADWLSDYKDVTLLKNKLPNVKRLIMFNKSLEFSYLEFAYGTRVKSFVNDPVLKILREDLNISRK